MTTAHSTPASAATAVRPIAIVYEVPTPRKVRRVTVTRHERGVSYDCSCGLVALYGDCPHCEAVRAARQAQGLP